MQNWDKNCYLFIIYLVIIYAAYAWDCFFLWHTY